MPKTLEPHRRLYYLRQALHSLKDARDSIRLAGAPYTRLKLKAAQASLEGAIRHAEGRVTAEEMGRPKSRSTTHARRARRGIA